MSEEIFREAFKKLASDVASTLAIENALSGKGPVKIPRSRGRGLKDSADFCPQPRTAIQITRGVLKECNAERKGLGAGLLDLFARCPTPSDLVAALGDAVSSSSFKPSN